MKRGSPRRLLPLLSLALLLAMFSARAGADWAVIDSPDGRLSLSVSQMDLGAVTGRYPAGQLLYYQLRRDGVTVLDWSPLGLQLDNADLAFALQHIDTAYASINDSYALVHGKRAELAYTANEALVTALGTGGQPLVMRFRVFDDGFAFRYELLGGGTVTVTNELSAFRLPAGSVGYLTEAVPPAPFQPGYEALYHAQLAGTSGGGDGFYFPALFKLPDSDTHLLLHEAGLYESYAGTRLDSDASDRVYQLRLPSAGEGDPLQPVNPTMTLPATTPWRVVMVGALADIVESNLVTHLGLPLDAAFGGDTSWVQPGKAAWSWFSQGTGTPALQREYIDSAAEFGWDYVIVDADWSLWPDAETEVPALVQYAAQRGVKIILWYNSGGPNNQAPFEPRDRLDDAAAMQAEFAQLSAWGVAGVKVDFFRSDKQARIAQYRGLLRTAAEHQLQVVLHGSTPPRGWRREFPNLLTSEAVLGSEHYLWDLGPDAAHNVSLVFTRNVVGAMDYTPLAFDEALSEKGVSYGHQLALSVAFESALQAFADRADASPDQGFRALFGRFPFVRDFLQGLPTAWEDTRLLDGDPATHAVVARKQGGRWYIAGLNAESTPRTVSLDLSLLTSGQYQAELIRDGAAGNELLQSFEILSDQSPFEITMAPSGGFVLVVNVGWEESPWRFDPFDGPWRVSPWLGYVNDYWGPWVLHREHGWWQILNPDPDNLSFLTAEGDWWWTSQSLYPYLFDVTRGHWLYYIVDSTDPRLFYNFTLGELEAR